MSAQVEINVRSPLGTVTVKQDDGKSWNYGPEIEHEYLLHALSGAVRQVSGAYGITPKELADALAQADESENR